MMESKVSEDIIRSQVPGRADNEHARIAVGEDGEE